MFIYRLGVLPYEMHCQRQLRRERGIATTHQAILAEVRWVIRSCRVTKVNRAMDRVMRLVDIEHQMFRHRNHRLATQSTIVRLRRPSKANADFGISETHAS